MPHKNNAELGALHYVVAEVDAGIHPFIYARLAITVNPVLNTLLDEEYTNDT